MLKIDVRKLADPDPPDGDDAEDDCCRHDHPREHGLAYARVGEVHREPPRFLTGALWPVGLWSFRATAPSRKASAPNDDGLSGGGRRSEKTCRGAHAEGEHGSRQIALDNVRKKAHPLGARRRGTTGISVGVPTAIDT